MVFFTLIAERRRAVGKEYLGGCGYFAIIPWCLDAFSAILYRLLCEDSSCNMMFDLLDNYSIEDIFLDDCVGDLFLLFHMLSFLWSFNGCHLTQLCTLVEYRTLGEYAFCSIWL